MAVAADPLPEGDIDPPTADTTAWLQDEGRPLVDALLAGAPLATAPDGEVGIESCRDTAASMDEHGTPQDLRALAAGAPDAEARAVLLNDLTAKVTLLANCGETVEGDLVDEVAFTHAVVVRWLEESP